MSDPQSAAAVMMVRPVRFEVNELTAATNEFQHTESLEPVKVLQRRARLEFDGLVDRLRAAGVMVCDFDDTPDPHKPDSIFPNNWVSFHRTGAVVLYPKMAENRRLERRPELIAALGTRHGFTVGEVIDFSPHELEGRFLEGTGSLVFDRVNRIAYACLSQRTHPDLVRAFAARFDYEVMAFEAFGPSGLPVYHTNVMLAIGAGSAVVCADAVRDAGQRAGLLARLEGTGHEVVTITSAQMLAFAGNMLELVSRDGERLLVMSRRAEASLRDDQREGLARHAKLISAPVDTIEDCSGGSVRCMLAAIHLPHPELP